MDHTVKNRDPKKRMRSLFEIVDSVATALVCVVLLFTLVFRIFVVSGESMLTTLFDGDRLVVSNLFYEPERGDIIVFASEYKDEEVLVKRVIATEGQTVDISKEGEVTVDGVAIDEPYLQEGMFTAPGTVSLPFVVAEDQLFVMGDNRVDSLDSRSELLGPVEMNKVLGRVLFRLFPHTGKVQ